jgi:hypothetical protein
MVDTDGATEFGSGLLALAGGIEDQNRMTTEGWKHHQQSQQQQRAGQNFIGQSGAHGWQR